MQNNMLVHGLETMTFDLIQTLVLLGIALGVALIYMLRVVIRGPVHYDRIDKQGGSALLNKRLMEMAYWSLQPLARLLIFFKVTPNMVSWVSLFFGILAGACLAVGHFGFGAVFATVSAFMDSLDGMVARLTHVASDAGEVLDAAIDRYVEFLFLGGLIIYYREIPILVVLSLLALLGSFMVSYSTAKAEALNVEPPKGNMRRPERALYLTLGALLSPVTIPIFEQIREFSIPIGHPMIIALSLVAVLSNVSAVERFWAIAKAIRIREVEVAEARRRVAQTVLVTEEEQTHAVTDGPVKVR